MTLRCGVLVVGGGVAGVPAAVAASRAGAQTLLIEQRAFPGGAGVVGLHRFICGLYLNGAASSDVLLNPGLVNEICRRLGATAPARAALRIGRVDVLPYDPARLRDVFSGLLKDEKRLRALFGATVKSVAFDGRRVHTVVTDQGEAVPAVLVDCSGDGVVIQSSPSLHEVAAAQERQLAGGAVRFSGLKDVDETLAIRVPYALHQAAEAGKLPPGLQFTVFVAGDEPGEGWCRLSLPSAPRRGGMGIGEAARIVHACLRESLSAFRGALIVAMSPEVLEREGPRLKGEYTLTGEDVLAGRKFPDSAVRNAWPVELWDQDRGATYRYLPAGECYEIPLRCLKAAAVENLLCAGRCISVSREALGSTRVMGACMALGEAAGKEAARMALQQE